MASRSPRSSTARRSTARRSTTPVQEAIATAAAYRAAQEKEYGTYVALGPIDLLGVRAFNEGDPVPVSHVERGIVDRELVAGRSTQAAEAAIEEAAAPPVAGDVAAS